jgi:RNA polymerase sigma-70 factor, ECF subfamily
LDYSTLDDADLFVIISELGDSPIAELKLNEAIGELYDRYGRLVYSIALQIVGDQGTAEEVTQDVFLKAYEGARSYHPEISKASSWLASIARHRAIDELRRRGARAEKDMIDWPDDVGKDYIDGLPLMEGPEQSIEFLQDSKMILRMISSLPQDQRRVLGLAFFQGYSHNEIAALLSEPLGTIKSRIRMGMQRMKELLLEVDYFSKDGRL